jgi:hypothetical protein
MGGGGGSSNLTPRNLDRLAKVAKDALKAGAQPQKRNVFLSFVEEDLASVNLLRGQAKNENSDIEFNDWSLTKPFDSKDADYIKRGIRERIRQSSMTIVYVSDRTAASPWVDWEIREALAMGKAVIAMYQGPRPPTHLPRAVVEHKIRLVPWKQETLAKAIEQATGNP